MNGGANMRRFYYVALALMMLFNVACTHERELRTADDYYNRGTASIRKGDLDEAIADYNKAIELNPNDADAYDNRGKARKGKGDAQGAIADYTKAISLDEKNAPAYNSLAWLLATTPKQGIRDGKLAVEYARKACELTKWQEPNYLDTLAAAYAEAGDFQYAVEWEKEALEFLDFAKETREEAHQRLELYSKGQPYREN
jgi:tetratricopeptide (TPR) repeat protein